MSNDKNNYSNTNEIANSSDEVPVNEGEQQTATEAMRTQGSEIKHDNVQPSEKEETQDDSTTIREDDQNKTNADLSAETTEVKENEEQNLKKTSDETNCAEKLQTHDTDVTNGEQPEMSEGSSSEKEKENKKKVNLVKWFKKNVSIHLPKRHSLRKEKSATEHKMEIVDHEEEASSLPLSII
ncbi:unnamed protein product [Heterobilharzia americana]|nr:unnamed protein product [Heterobilharzia americana]